MFYASFVTHILRQKIFFSPKIAKIVPNRYPHNAKKNEKNELPTALKTRQFVTVGRKLMQSNEKALMTSDFSLS